MRRWITGGEIIKRWDALPFELFEPMEKGELVPVRPENGERQTKKVNPCLYCEGGDPLPTAFFNYRTCRLSPSIECSEWGSADRIKRIMEAKFRGSEVLAYEQLHGLGPLLSYPECEDSDALPEQKLRKALDREIGEEDAKAILQRKLADGIFSKSISLCDHPTPSTDFVTALQTQDNEGAITPCPAPEVLPDSPVDYVQQMKIAKLDVAEIKDRLYSNGKKAWNLTWWKVHCIVEGKPYPSNGKMGAAEKIDYKNTCLRQIKAWRKQAAPKIPNSAPKTPTS